MQKAPTEKAVVLFSGGLDSTTILYYASSLGYAIFPISFRYGQRHEVELAFAKNIIAKHQNQLTIANHQIIDINLDLFNKSALINNQVALDERTITQILEKQNSLDLSHIPNSYVPARNSIFLAYAFGYAETIEASKIFIGVNTVDYSGYPDCRPQFITAFQNLINNAISNKAHKINIETPLIDLSKTEIIKIGKKLGLDYNLTFSCYNPIIHKVKDKQINVEICQKCDSCLIRSDAFSKLNIPYNTNHIIPLSLMQ